MIFCMNQLTKIEFELHSWDQFILGDRQKEILFQSKNAPEEQQSGSGTVLFL